MAFHENWFTKEKRRRLRQCLDQVPEGRGELVEVGAWEGRSTIMTAKFFPNNKLHVIDHWGGNPSDERSKTAGIAAKRDVYKDFIDNVTKAGVKDRLVIHKMGWRQAFKSWDQPIRYLFLDGPHTYKEVADNITQALDLLVPGAVLCGDDYFFWPDVAEACKDTLGEVYYEKTNTPAKQIWSWVKP